MKYRAPNQFQFHISETKSLNKSGFVVDDLHVLISLYSGKSGGDATQSTREETKGGAAAAESFSYSQRHMNTQYPQRPLKTCKLKYLLSKDF